MPTSACLLIVASLSLHFGADNGDKQAVVATIFGEPLYLQQVTPADIESKLKELPRGESDNWLRQARGRRTYENIWFAVLRKYIEREKLSVSPEELAAITQSVERRLALMPEAAPNTFTSAERTGVMVAWSRGSLMDWKVCKSLHEKHGGRVGVGSLGSWTAWDGQRALLKEHIQAGDIQFQNDEIEQAFWQHTKIKNFADAYPESDELKRLLATPPYLQN